ncbi:unnamed protein product [Spirodela intermedia]|uniref:Uncharacterized protein n=1 Tax=Spirodela intermedia TaxID=51605 RepID=A0A7I8L5C5_SPIIN|nr:unnamed protein product [Spirodela intermedia]
MGEGWVLSQYSDLPGGRRSRSADGGCAASSPEREREGGQREMESERESKRERDGEQERERDGKQERERDGA